MDLDLLAYRGDAAAAAAAREAGTPDADDGVAEAIVAVVDRCLEESLPAFRATVQDIVDELEVSSPSLSCALDSV